MFAPQKGRENPVIRRALDLFAADGIPVFYHEDTVEVRFGASNKRFYTTWSQFLADSETLFGERMYDGVPEEARMNADRRMSPDRRAEAAMADAPYVDRRVPPPPESNVPADEEIIALKKQIKLLERAVYVVGMQSEEWKKEVAGLRQELDVARLDMRQLIDSREQRNGSGIDRYKQLRQVIVRRLHPDGANTDEEKRHREKLFKTIWSEIEQLDRK